MTRNKIEEISLDVKNFLAKSTKTSEKINNIEERVNKMQNYLTSPMTEMDTSSAEEKAAFSNFLRYGIESDLIKKSFHGGADEGGALLAPTLSKKIIDGIKAKSPMRQLASIESISTRALDVILEDGAFVSGWIAETAARADTATPQLRKKTIQTHEIYAQPKATQTLIDDSEINIDNWLVERLTDSFVRLENEAFITGDGNNKPFGLLSNADVQRVQVGANVEPDTLLSLINSLDEGHLANASFLMNRTTLSALQGLRDGEGRFIWQQSMTDPLKQTVFGIPVVVSSHMPDIAENALSIALGDFKSAYKIVDRSNISIVRDPYTDKPYVKFYTVKRVGGDVVNPGAMKFARFTA